MALRCALSAAVLCGVARGNGRHDASGNVIEGLAPEELAVSASGKLGDVPPSYDFWSAGDRTGPAPYPYPANRVYNTTGGPVEGKINIHLVPHSHDDTGWQVTVDQYFEREVYFIIDTIAQQLAENPDRKFIYVETAFFARWWEEADDFKRGRMRKLVKDKQLEFINGGWCMHDEASPLWTAMVDQTTRGHQFIYKNFGEPAAPRGTWQIDPFGHSNTEAWLLGAEAGMESLFWGRMDYEDRDARYALNASDPGGGGRENGPTTGGFEWIWEGSKSLGASAQVFAGNLFGTGSGGYSTWMNFDGTDQQINDDPRRHDYNLDAWVDAFVQDAAAQAGHTLTDHQLWACGTDFQYQNADHWFRNLDKLIHYVNLNGTVNAFYSTPTSYTAEKRKDKKVVWEVRTDDIFPLADNAHDYWSGYFTSRPALKRQVRFATNFLAAARLLEVWTNTTASEAGEPKGHRSPPVGTSFTDSLEGTVGVATHHDGMSGTERQDVSDDYQTRIAQASVEAEAGVAIALGKALGVDAGRLKHCNCNAAEDCLNMTVCAYTSGSVDGFSIAAFNTLGQAQPRTPLRVPVASRTPWSCAGADGAALPTQVTALDDRTRRLPLLYLNEFGLTAAEIAAARRNLANTGGGVLSVLADLPPVGLTTITCAPSPDPAPSPTAAGRGVRAFSRGGDLVVSNGILEATFDEGTAALSGLKNLRSGVSATLTATWGWYNSSVGGCTEYPANPGYKTAEPCSTQASGAYIFRPNSSALLGFDPAFAPTLAYEAGDVVAEVRLQSSAWASHVVRLYAGASHLEVEWTAGPIPVDTPWFAPVAFSPDGGPLPNNWGKELVLKYDTDLATAATYHTDSNGKEMVKRVTNRRGPSYPRDYVISEPVAGNYYPVNALASIDDGVVEFDVVVDASLGGASLEDGSLEFMVHRRLQADDNRGVQEPLNETMCGCNDVGAAPGSMGAHGREGDGGCDCQGLTVRGTHYLVLDTIDNARELRRALSESINFPPTLAFGDRGVPPKTASLISKALPANVKLVTLTSNYESFHGGAWLLRLSHLYEAGESALAVPVAVDLSEIFAEAGLTITTAVETSLTANGPLPPPPEAWKSAPATDAQAAVLEDRAAAAFTEKVPFAYPVVTIRPMEVRTFLATFN